MADARGSRKAGRGTGSVGGNGENGCVKPGHKLLPQHQEDLRQSGLQDETIRAGGFHSLTDPVQIAQVLAWPGGAKKLGPCLCIPFFDLEGRDTGFARLKPDKPRKVHDRRTGKRREVKYEQPKGAPVRPYFPNGAGQAILDPATPLLITEGEKKACAAWQAGFACIGLTGVDCWSVRRKRGKDGRPEGERELLPQLATIPWRGRLVYLVFDSDAASKPEVQWAEWALARALARHGAQVKVVRFLGGAGPEKVGLDDFLLTHSPEELRGLLESAQEPTRPDDRPAIVLGTDEHRVVSEVTDVLAGHPRLFQRDGAVVQPLTTDGDGQGEDGAGGRGPSRLRVKKPPGLTVFRAASPALVRNYISESCSLQTWRNNKLVGTHPPDWLPPQVLAVPGRIRTIRGLAQGPTLRPDGGLLNTQGYDAATGLYLARALPGLALPEHPTLADAQQAGRTLYDLVADFPWEQEADFARWLTLLLAAACRHLIDRTPLGMVTANVAGAGKTCLCRLISIIVHGLADPVLMSWPEGSRLQARGDEIRKRLASLLHEGATLVVIDNLPRGMPFSSPELEAFLTADAYHDRELGRNDGRRVGGPNCCSLLATGNNVRPNGDSGDRTLIVNLSSKDPNPRSRKPDSFRLPDIEKYTWEHRAQLLRAALTIWRAWVLAGEPQPEGPSWGSFYRFVETAVAAVRWLGLPDPLGDRVEKANEADEEGQALQTLVASWNTVLGAEPLTAGTIIERITETDTDDTEALVRDAVRALREALLTLCPARGGAWPPSPGAVGRVLTGHKDRPIQIKEAGQDVVYVLHCEKDLHVKANVFTVRRLAEDAEVAEDNVTSGGETSGASCSDTVSPERVTSSSATSATSAEGGRAADQFRVCTPGAESPAIMLVTDAAGLEVVVDALLGADIVGLDLETTGLDPRKDRTRLLSLAVYTFDGGTFAYLVDCFAVDPRPLFGALAETTLVAHNAAFDLGFLAALGFEPGAIHDSMIMSQLLHGTRKEHGFHGLDQVAERELGRHLEKGLQKADWSGSLTADQLEYAATDAAVLLPLYRALATQVKETGQEQVAQIEARCLPAMVWLARSGTPFDRDAWTALAQEAGREVEDLARQLGEAAPLRDGYLPKEGAWNWRSSQQVQEAFRLLGVELQSTDDDTLARVEHPLADLLRRHRAASKRASTYGLDWLTHVALDGRVYAAWRQLGADSGRMSCSAPNLQNLPRGAAYRRCFRAPAGRVLVKADYSQIELRIAAKVSGDTAMLEAYRCGDDLHTLTARCVLGIQDVSKEHRQLAKALNFGLLYGMGARGFRMYAKSQYGLDLTEQQARGYRQAFFDAYPGVAAWHRRVRSRREAETRTLAGRRRIVDAKTPDTQRLNTPVQGTGADGLKRALAYLWEQRHECPGSFPVLVVHDEIVVECDAGQAEAAAAWLRQAMFGGMAPLIDPVPCEVEVQVGQTWGG
jgi:DNA polymerase-1